MTCTAQPPALPGAEPALLPLPQLRSPCERDSLAVQAAVDSDASGADHHDYHGHQAARMEPPPPPPLPLEQHYGQSDSSLHCSSSTVAVTELPLSGGYAIGAGLHLQMHPSATVLHKGSHYHGHGHGHGHGYTHDSGIVWPPPPILPLHTTMHAASAAAASARQQHEASRVSQPLRRVHWRGMHRGGILFRGAAPVQAQLTTAGVPPALLLQLQLRGLPLADASEARHG